MDRNACMPRRLRPPVIRLVDSLAGSLLAGSLLAGGQLAGSLLACNTAPAPAGRTGAPPAVSPADMTPGPVARFLTRELHRATRLEFAPETLSPRIVIARAAEAPWTSEDAQFEAGADGRLRVKCAAACTVTAVVPAATGVEYTLLGLGTGPVDELRVNSGSQEKDDLAHLGRSGSVFDIVHRTQRALNTLTLTLRAHGDFTLTQLQIREARLLTPTQLVATLAAPLTGYYRTAPAPGTERLQPALFSAGETRYEWPLDAGDARGLTFSTAVVPRHGVVGGPVRLSVEARHGDLWESRFEVVRGGPGDTGDWIAGRADLSGADAFRLSSRLVDPANSPANGPANSPANSPANGPATVTGAWGSPGLVPDRRANGRPDVVLITLDALRADKLGAFGSTEGLSPTLDALAAQGARFSEARCQRGETWVSLSSLAYGAWPEDIDVGMRGAVPSRGHHTLAETFAAAGYRTARIGNVKMPPGHLGEFEVEYETTADPPAVLAAERFLAEDDGRPVFLWVHLQVTHYPYSVPPPLWLPARDGALLDRTEFMGWLAAGPTAPDWKPLLARNLRLYDAAIRTLDANVARLTAPLLRSDSPRGPPVLALAADHGTTLGEHGMWFMHGLPYRAVLRVPLLVVAPGRVTAGTTVDGLVRLMDLAPTLLDYAGLLEPVADHFSARTLRGLIEGRPEPGRTNIVQLVNKQLVVVETERHKLIANPTDLKITFHEAGKLEDMPPRAALYAWREDHTETRDLTPDNPLLAGELWRLVVDARATLERTVTPETRRLLIQAGYAAPSP